MGAIKKHTKYHQFINLVEANLQEIPLELPIKHYFTEGMYVREIFIPKGVTLTSRVHLTEHPFFVSMGVIDIISNDSATRVVAPYTGVSPKGARRLGFAVEDCIFSTVHTNPDNCKDLDVLEARLFQYYDNPLLASKTMEAIQ